MLLLSAKDLSKAYTDHPLFKGLDLELYHGQRVGLVGLNGIGKSTLLKILARKDAADVGEVLWHAGARVSYLEQHPQFDPERTLFEEAQSALGVFLHTQQELIEVTDAMAAARDEEERQQLSKRYDRLHEMLLHHDAYHTDHWVEQVLTGLGFASEAYTRPVATFSGGQQSRVLLAKMLLSAPDVLLLDEPSNHLDIQTTEWLENYLSQQNEAMLIVSHDRAFLDRVVTHIWEMDGRQLNIYPGNYSQYVKLRRDRLELQRKTWEAQQEQIAKEEEYIRRVHYGQLSQQAQSRQKKLDKLERVERPVAIESPNIQFPTIRHSGDVVVEADRLGKQFDQPLFAELSFQLKRGERLGILGPNGCGKTTLLRILLGEESPSSGSARLGHHVDVGYYDQHLGSLDEGLEALRAAWPSDDPDMTEQRMRNHLAAFGLTGAKVYQTVGSLSGGERSRVALARLAALKVNLLILDEPTNHLDLWACESLEEALKAFEGTVIVVSHDRYFLNRIVDLLIVFTPQGVQVVRGNYETYQRLQKWQAPLPSPAKPNSKEAKGSAPAVAAAPKRKRKFPYRKIEDIEADIHAVERELKDWEAKLMSPDLYKEGQRVPEITQAFEEAKARLAQLYEHWEEAVELSKR